MTTIRRDDEGITWICAGQDIGPTAAEQGRRITEAMRCLPHRQTLCDTDQSAAIGTGETGPGPDVAATGVRDGGDDGIKWHSTSPWGELHSASEQSTEKNQNQ